jgi:hypothetical protein
VLIGAGTAFALRAQEAHSASSHPHSLFTLRHIC